MNQIAKVAMPAMPFGDIERLGIAIAKSNLFGIRTPEQAVALMMIAQAEGRHPALAARDYDIIQGRPAKKAEAMLRDFLEAGGKVEWHALTDDAAEATFSHPQGGTVRLSWDQKRAAAAQLGNKDNWKKFPRAMLRSRTVSEGVRTVWPMATSGMYVPEEVREFAGTTIEHEPPTQEATTEHKPTNGNGKRTWGGLLRELGERLAEAADENAVHAVTESDDAQKVYAQASANVQAELTAMLGEAMARVREPAADPFAS